jgi:5-methylcytosine-specific restriction endonuclease McrA
MQVDSYWGMFQLQRRMHPVPSSVRFAVLERSRGKCELCGSSPSRIELHHRTYFRHDGIYATWGHYYPERPPLIFGHETKEDLIALCWRCHKAQHLDAFGKFCWNPEEAEVSRFNELINK